MVVCVHGLSRQGRDFDTLAAALVARSPTPLRVVCADVVGRGRSEWLQDPQGYQLPTYASDMLAMLAHLHAQAPVHELSWVGTSMGGLIGMAIALVVCLIASLAHPGGVVTAEKPEQQPLTATPDAV